MVTSCISIIVKNGKCKKYIFRIFFVVMADSLDTIFVLHRHVLERCTDRDLEAFAESVGSLSRRVVDKIRMQRYVLEELYLHEKAEEEEEDPVASSSSFPSPIKNAHKEAWLGCNLARAAMEFNKRSLEGVNKDLSLSDTMGSWIGYGWAVHAVRCQFNDEDAAHAVLYLRRVGSDRLPYPVWKALAADRGEEPYFAPGLLHSFDDVDASKRWHSCTGTIIHWRHKNPIWYNDEEGMQKALRACTKSGDRFGGANFPNDWAEFRNLWMDV